MLFILLNDIVTTKTLRYGDTGLNMKNVYLNFFLRKCKILYFFRGPDIK